MRFCSALRDSSRRGADTPMPCFSALPTRPHRRHGPCAGRPTWSWARG